MPVFAFLVANKSLRIANSCHSFPELLPRNECTGMAPIARSVNGPRSNTFTRITASHRTKEQEYKLIFADGYCNAL